MKLIAVIFLIVAAGASTFVYTQKLKDEKIAEIHAPLLAFLKDPLSAQFRNEHYASDGKNFCGEMNAKNGMGGYAGFKRFISNTSTFALDGYSVVSFYPDLDQSTDAISRKLEMEIDILKKEKRNPTDKEIDHKMFDELWKQLAC
jgi:hypothetical protein